MVRRKRFGLSAVSVSAAAALIFALAPTTWADPGHVDVTPEQQRALDAGIQIAPKGGATAKAARNAPNPYLANLPNVKSADYSGWKQRLAQQGAAARQVGNSGGEPGQGPRAGPGGPVRLRRAGTRRQQRLQRHPGQRRADSRLRHGPPGEPAGPHPRLDRESGSRPHADHTAEDNGSIPLATADRHQREGRRPHQKPRSGDGPHGGPDGSSDFDFFK